MRKRHYKVQARPSVEEARVPLGLRKPPLRLPLLRHREAQLPRVLPAAPLRSLPYKRPMRGHLLPLHYTPVLTCGKMSHDKGPIMRPGAPFHCLGPRRMMSFVYCVLCYFSKEDERPRRRECDRPTRPWPFPRGRSLPRRCGRWGRRRSRRGRHSVRGSECGFRRLSREFPK